MIKTTDFSREGSNYEALISGFLLHRSTIAYSQFEIQKSPKAGLFSMTLLSTSYQMQRKGLSPGVLFLPTNSLPVLWGESPNIAVTHQSHIRDQMWRLFGCDICHPLITGTVGNDSAYLGGSWGLSGICSMFPRRGNTYTPFQRVMGV